MKKQAFIGILLISLSIYSCASRPGYTSIEQIEMEPVKDQIYLVSVLEDLVNSYDPFSIHVYTRKTFSPKLKQTKLFIHSFYLIDLYDKGYYTLSFCGTDFKLYTDGIWVLNKDTDISSYQLFLSGNNIWGVEYSPKNDSLDDHQILANVIDIVKCGSKYYYRDHLLSRPNSLNCNSAVNGTLAFKQPIVSETVALKQ